MMESKTSMFFALRHVWRFLTESWSSPLRARLLYGAFALGFLGLAIGGIAKGDATVIALGVGFAIVTAALAVFAPRLSGATRRNQGREL